MKTPSFLRRGGLFAKYFLSLVGIVTLVLLINGGLDMWFAYGTAKDALARLQHEKANAAADKVGQFINEIERQIGWTTHPQWAAAPADQRRFDFIRLQRQVPAITELTQIDGSGREQLKVSRLAMDVAGSNADLSHDPRFTEVQNKRVWYSPVYLRKESEPYMSISLARTGRRAGATAAEVNLKLIWDVVSAIKVGEKGYAYVVDRDGRLIAHPDISLVLRNTSMSRLAHVRAALDAARDGKPLTGDSVEFGLSLDGTPVLSSVALIPALGWLVFVEQPTAEALQPLYTSLLQTAALLGLGLAIAAIGAWFLSRRMAGPISIVSAGAARLGAGDLAHRIDVKTGDEVQALGDNFNSMATRLQESYADLEQKVETRTRELARSVEELTASGEILRLIAASPDDLQPMFQTVLEHATRLCEAGFGTMWLVEGDALRPVAMRGASPAYEAHRMRHGPIRPDRDTALAQARDTLRPVQIEDVRATAGYAAGDPVRRAGVDLGGVRTLLTVPMIRQGEAVGVLAIYRQEQRLFTEKHVSLLSTFADQAAIAIENSRLLRELRSRTTELARSVDELTASSEILRLIASSPDDLQPMFQSILEHGMRLCEANFGALRMFEGDMARVVAMRGVPSSYEAYLKAGPMRASPDSAIGRVRLTGVALQDEDVRATAGYIAGDPVRRAGADIGGIRTLLAVPLVRQGEVIGALSVYRQEVRLFTAKQVNLLTTFADQAVIAIENSRLLGELRARTDELSESLENQTATSELLKVISRSTFNLEPVLQTVATTAADLCQADEAAIFLLRDGAYRWAASVHINSAYVDAVRAETFKPGRDSLIGRTALEGRIVQIEDALADPEYGRKDLARLGGVRTLLGVPLLRNGTTTGVMVLTRRHVERFADKHIEILHVFADQAVIAVENVRLFTEIQEKSRQLEIASQHKSQFLANMSHELRTPLNAILGYAEMIADGLYGEIGDKAQGVLERVQSNGRHLLGLINDVLDLSKIEAGQLTLAHEQYSVADMVATVVAATESLTRAKGLALTTSVASGLPTGTGDARRLSQVLLNLVGNAIKFTDRGSVEIRAAQADDRFELSVVDTGLGIAPADQARVFEEFQQVDNTSTRKKGGTGLGLAISRRIIELHGGDITVESEVAKGSTFKVTIPINAAPIKDAA